MPVDALRCPPWRSRSRLLALAVAGAVVVATAGCAPRTSAHRPPSPRRRPAPRTAWTRGRRASSPSPPTTRVRAVVQRQQAGQRQGLRVRRRVRGGRAPRLRRRRRDLDPGHVQQRDRARARRRSTSTSTSSPSPSERKQAVDFSVAVLPGRGRRSSRIKGSKIAGATSLADLKDAKLGAQVGTTSYQAITELIKPTAKPQVFNSNDDAKKALQNGTVDGLVVDLPTAFYMTAAELDRRRDRRPAAAGRRARAVRPGAGQGLAADRLRQRGGRPARQDGTLAELEKKWLAAGGGGAPSCSVTHLRCTGRSRRRSGGGPRTGDGRRSVRVLLAPLSTAVLGTLLVVAVTGAPGWDRVRQSFLDPEIARDALPEVARRALAQRPAAGRLRASARCRSAC